MALHVVPQPFSIDTLTPTLMDLAHVRLRALQLPAPASLVLRVPGVTALTLVKLPTHLNFSFYFPSLTSLTVYQRLGLTFAQRLLDELLNPKLRMRSLELSLRYADLRGKPLQDFGAALAQLETRGLRKFTADLDGACPPLRKLAKSFKWLEIDVVVVRALLK